MTSKVDIYTKNLELTEPIRSYIEKKTSKLSKHLKEIDETRIEISFNKNARVINDRFVTQITLRGPGFILRAEERSNELYPTLDLVMDKIERQIERYKGKRYRSLSSLKAQIEATNEAPTEDQFAESSHIVKRKRFRLIPMDELEAIEQMNLLGHEDFFIFFNIKTNRIGVLYRRRDGSYGIIEPEIS